MCSRHSPPIGRHSVSPCLFLANRYEFITEVKSEGGQASTQRGRKVKNNA
jgi:hypothetical protein